MWLANKLKRQDSSTHLDAWKITKIDGGAHRLTPRLSVADKTIQKSLGHIILIPFGNYKEYDDWKEDISDGYTLSPGDIVFFEDPGKDVSANNIVSLKNSKRSVEVKEFFVVEKKFGTKYQIKILG